MHISRLGTCLLFLLLLVGCGADVNTKEASFSVKETSDHEAETEAIFFEEVGEPYEPLQSESYRDPTQYSIAKTKVKQRLAELTSAYVQGGDSVREKVRLQADSLLLDGLAKELIPYWYGTEWDFNGITTTPNNGVIACGYFISTLLVQMGVNVQRYKLAQQGANEIIESLCIGTKPVRLEGNDPTVIKEHLKNESPGIYVVGLDNHVGFIHRDTNEVYFLHASYADPAVVVKEIAAESQVLSWSGIYVLGRLSGNDELLDKWLTGKPVKTVFTQ